MPLLGADCWPTDLRRELQSGEFTTTLGKLWLKSENEEKRKLQEIFSSVNGTDWGGSEPGTVNSLYSKIVYLWLGGSAPLIVREDFLRTGPG